MTKAQIELAIYISAALVAIGVFLPLTSLPVYGDVSYNRVAAIESYMVIAFALSAPVLIFLGKGKLLPVSTAGIWLTMLFPAIREMLIPRDDSFFAELADSAASVMTDFAADMFLNITEFSWGGLLFLLGLLTFTVFSVLLFLKAK